MSDPQQPKVILCQLEDDYKAARAAGIERKQAGKVVNGYRCKNCGKPLVVSVFAVGVIMHEHGITLCNPCGAQLVEKLGAQDRVERVELLPNALEQLADQGITVADLLGRTKPK